jgi:hypothetical protein
MVDWADAASAEDAGRIDAAQDFILKSLSSGGPTMDPRAINELLSREMAHLTMEEKRDIDDEVHGFYSRHPSPGGDPPMEHRCRHLEDFQNEIDKMDARDKWSYLRACSIQEGRVALTMMDPGGNDSTLHVLKEDYQLRFLRTTIYDVKKAALRYCRWLDLLVDYFGEEVLTRPIFLTDLDEDSCSVLKKGMIQLLPGRDRSGRRIIAFMRQAGEGRRLAMRAVVSMTLDVRGCREGWCFLPLLMFVGKCADAKYIILIGLLPFSLDWHFPGTQLKATIFLNDTASSDETTSRHGLVGICWPSVNMGAQLSDAHCHRETTRFLGAQPVRYSAFHMCIEPSPAVEQTSALSPQNYVLRLVYALLMVAMSKDDRMVTKLHTGAQLYLQFLDNHFLFEVLSFHIPHHPPLTFSHHRHRKLNQHLELKLNTVFTTSMASQSKIPP